MRQRAAGNGRRRDDALPPITLWDAGRREERDGTCRRWPTCHGRRAYWFRGFRTSRRVSPANVDARDHADAGRSLSTRAAKLRQQASVEDVDYRAARGLDRALFQKLAEGEWIDAHDNLALVGPSGVGKSWLACAIGQKACRDNRSVLYHRWPKLCEDLALARGDGRHPRLIKSLGRADLLILDDFGLEPLDAGARHDLLEILEERYGRRSTVVTSQLPLSAWHEVIGDPTYADAILDRLVHNARRIELTGESLRRTRGKQSKTA